MKKLNLSAAITGMVLTTLTLSSCLKDDGYSLDYYRISYATARSLNDRDCYFTLDNGATLWPAAPINMHFHPTKLQRVQLNYTLLGDNFQGYDYAIRVNRLDTILTKLLAENKGAGNDSIYGNDPVEIIEMWIGDGFLNIIFKMGYSGHFKHAVNLLQDTTGVLPLKLEFRHNAFDDKSHYLVYGSVAFDLSEIDTKGEEIDLVIEVNTAEGMKEYKKKYSSGKGDTGLQPKLKPELKVDKNSLNYLE